MAVAKNNSSHKAVLKVSMDSGSEEDSSSSDACIESDNEEEDANSLTKKSKPTNDKIEGSTDDDVSEEADVDDDSDGDNDNKDVSLMTNEGWADSVAKILGSNKPKNKRTLVLSRAKKHVNIKIEKEEKPAFEVIGDGGVGIPTVQKVEPVTSEPLAKKVKHNKPTLRVKPNILEKDRERLLSKIATKGVVQLFNAVRNQQKTLQKEMDRNDLSEGKKEKILKKFDKRTFLDTLMGQSKSIVVDEEVTVAKNEVKDEDAPKWSALRDDFMMGAKMKDWDKESIDE